MARREIFKGQTSSSFCNREKSEGDIFLAYGDAAIHGQFNIGGPAEAGKVKFLFSQFTSVSGVATKVSSMLKALVPGASGAYREFVVPELDDHENVSSHSIKHGCIETMEANGVGGGHATDLSGHAPSSRGDGKGGNGVARGSAFDSYHKATPARVVIGAKATPPPSPTQTLLVFHVRCHIFTFKQL
jgi:hypothetical protein